MRRYARVIGRTGIGSAMIDLWIVVRADEAMDDEIIKTGFERVPAELTDDQVRTTYGVAAIYVIDPANVTVN